MAVNVYETRRDGETRRIDEMLRRRFDTTEGNDAAARDAHIRDDR
jgi:hypothetical protein